MDGQVLIEARERMMLARPAAAALLGISEAGLWRLEKGRREPNFDTVSKLVTFLHIDPRHLFPGTTGGQTGLMQMFSELRLDTGVCVVIIRGLSHLTKGNTHVYDYLKMVVRELNLPE